MPYFVNENPHLISVDDGTGRQRRVGKGMAVSADGAFADSLKNTSGVRTVSGDEATKLSQTTPDSKGEISAWQAREQGLAEVHGAVGAAGVAAPLQRVVGDDVAPLGPPTGTITTATDLALQSHEDRRAFAPGEALPGDEVDAATAQEPNPYGEPTAADVHNEQVAAKERVMALAKPLTEATTTVEDVEAGEFDSLTAGQLRDHLDKKGVKTRPNAPKRELLEEAKKAGKSKEAKS